MFSKIEVDKKDLSHKDYVKTINFELDDNLQRANEDVIKETIKDDSGRNSNTNLEIELKDLK